MSWFITIAKDRKRNVRDFGGNRRSLWHRNPQPCSNPRIVTQIWFLFLGYLKEGLFEIMSFFFFFRMLHPPRDKGLWRVNESLMHEGDI